MPTCTFVRVLWGTANATCWTPYLAGRFRGKILGDVRRAIRDPLPVPCITFVFGQENRRFLARLGVDAVLIDRQPVVWRVGLNDAWRHKLYAIRTAVEYFDEIVYIDYDLKMLADRLPCDFWTELRRRAEFQSPLVQYKNKKCPWRMVAPRKTPCGSFLYLRGPDMADRLLKIAESHEDWTDEVCAAFMVDELRPSLWGEGPEAGAEQYCHEFDPHCVVGPSFINRNARPTFARL